MLKEKDKFLNVQEVAELLKVNPITIYRKANQGQIPAIKFGKKWLFSETTLLEWIQSKQQTLKDNLKQPIISENIIRVISNQISSIKHIQLFYIFGSVAKGTNTPLSDIDFAYLDDGQISSFDLDAMLEEIIQKEIQNLRIDMVRLNTAPASLQHKVIHEGRLIYKKDDLVRALFEEKVIEGYLDYAFMLQSFYQEAKTGKKEVA
ncbi:MAG: hypothetical protein COS89_08930 [Deltaproteobacteria bacterium CG07_land_8_20_14_0_80_38_7]|nr:MAG: hypothetical protein COS89_08930 [Deltaproteobacteria bacterium CG07_land_8_20_14_0_80_38_7]